MVPVDGSSKTLLKDVSGYVAPRKLTALMGESGAGKVTHRQLILRDNCAEKIYTDDATERFSPADDGRDCGRGYSRQRKGFAKGF